MSHELTGFSSLSGKQLEAKTDAAHYYGGKKLDTVADTVNFGGKKLETVYAVTDWRIMAGK